MAALYGILDPNSSRAQVTRAAHHTIDSTLKTHNTSVSTVLHKDGSGYMMVRRGSQQFRVEWAAEETLAWHGTKLEDVLSTNDLLPELYTNPAQNVRAYPPPGMSHSEVR
jgi:hypothetical protein